MYHRITPSLKALSFHLFTVCTLCTGSAQALTTFTAGTPAKASEVNGNFVELDNRITDLEAKFSGPTIDIDCADDPTALETAIDNAVEGTTFIIAGTCTGPITADRHGLTLQAATAGTDGISAYAQYAPVLKVIARHIELEGLKITALPDGNPNTLGVHVASNGSADMNDLHVTGAENSIGIGRAASARLENTSNIDKMIVYDGGAAQIRAGNSGFKLGVFRNGTVEIRDTAAGSIFTELNAVDGAQIRSRGSATNITVNGKVTLRRSSSARFDGPLTVNHTPSDPDDTGVIVSDNSSLSLKGGTISASTEALGSSIISAEGTAFVDPTDETKGGYIFIDLASALELLTGSTAGAVEVDGNSSAVMENATLSGNASPWNPGHTFALEIDSGAQVEAEFSTINDFVNAQIGSVFVLEDSTLNGGVFVNQNASVQLQNSMINTTGATGGVCPSAWDEGIRIIVGGTMTMDDTSSINGHLHVGYQSMFAAWSVTDFGSTVDASAFTKNNLTATGQSVTGMVTCTDP